MVKTLVLLLVSDSLPHRQVLTSTDSVAAIALRAKCREPGAVSLMPPSVTPIFIATVFLAILLIAIPLAAILFVACMPVAAAEPETISESAKYRLKLPPAIALRQDDGLAILDSRDRLEVDIRWRRGIGAADLILLRGNWPSKVLVVFKGFKRLENVTICSGDRILSASSTESTLKSTGNCKISRWKSGGKFYFCFENCCLSDSSLKLSWVDFYRM